MGAFASLSGVSIVAGSVAVPGYGLWFGDVSLSSIAAMPENVSLVLGNLTMAGHVYRQAAFGGERKCRLVGGFGGWHRSITRKQYSLAGGVMASLILGDAALESGEKVNVPNDTNVGKHWVRQEGPASRSLRRLAESWYVDPDGITQIRKWPAKNISSAFTVESQDGGGGKVVVATEDYAAWMPNSTFKGPTLEGSFTVSGVLFKFTGEGEFRLEVLTQ